METNINFYSLLIIAALAFFLPLVVSRISKVKVPVVIGEILPELSWGKADSISFKTICGLNSFRFLGLLISCFSAALRLISHFSKK
jgi:hypothetical protein